MREIQSLSGDTIVILSPSLDILETLSLLLLTFIYFGFSILVLLSDKLYYEIDLVFFSGFTVSYVSVLEEDPDLSNGLDLSNAMSLSDSLIIGFLFFVWDACGLSFFKLPINSLH